MGFGTRRIIRRSSSFSTGSATKSWSFVLAAAAAAVAAAGRKDRLADRGRCLLVPECGGVGAIVHGEKEEDF